MDLRAIQSVTGVLYHYGLRSSCALSVHPLLYLVYSRSENRNRQKMGEKREEKSAGRSNLADLFCR